MDRNQLNELRARLSEADGMFIEIQDELINDVKICSDLLFHHDTECWRRAYIRAVFAFIEGGLYAVKRVFFRESELKNTELTSAEKAFLLEETYQLDEKGDTQTKPHYGIRLSQNLRFVSKMVYRIYGVESGLSTSGSEWASFQEAIKIRNRITHPKDRTDLTVSDADLKYVKDTYEWLVNDFFYISPWV